MEGEKSMKNNNKIVVIGAVVLAVLLIVLGSVWAATRPATEDGSKKITVEVMHKDGSTKTFNCTTTEEYLAPVLVSEKIVEDNQGEYGLYILVADGERADYAEDGAYWSLLQNGEAAATGASEVVIHDGDSFSLVYTVA